MFLFLLCVKCIWDQLWTNSKAFISYYIFNLICTWVIKIQNFLKNQKKEKKHLVSWFPWWHARCTRVENPGDRVTDVFAKIPRGVKAFRKFARGGPTILGFIAFLVTSVSKFAWGGSYIYQSPSTPPPVCIYDGTLFMIINRSFKNVI